MTFLELEKIVNGKIIRLHKNRAIKYLVIDSRKALVHDESIFFCIQGPRNDGHEYISILYPLGIRQFVIEKPIDAEKFPEANFILVPSTVQALQRIAEFHRHQFNIPVIGITGSNGKTIVKEWLYQLLSPDKSIIKNPGSYNSQIGVPLSVWAMDTHHQIGIFEAGISQPDEMAQLKKIIDPTIGIFTNIGSAHSEGFLSTEEKISEKLKLFADVKVLIYCADHLPIDTLISKTKIAALSWGENPTATIQTKVTPTGFQLSYQEKSFTISLSHSNAAFKENAMHCIAVMLYLGYEPEVIEKRVASLKSVSMRLELKEGINQCQVIDDTYNNDLAGLQISLDFLSSLPKKKVVILSDVLQTGLRDDDVAQAIASLLVEKQVTKLIGIGPMLQFHQKYFAAIPVVSFYKSTDEFLEHYNFNLLSNELILIKGARVFQFEKIVRRLQRKVHGTVMEIDLGKLVHNLNFFKSKLSTNVKLMVMVKAFAYGSGSEEVAHVLQYHKVDYLSVAYADEGVELRKKNISLPIMVMNPTEESLETLLAYQLEPVIYNLKILKAFLILLAQRSMSIHLEVETGLHRLGLEEEETTELFNLLKKNPHVTVQSVFSHLSGSEAEIHDDFSALQYERFQRFYEKLAASLAIKPLRHILNSAGILRSPQFQLDMVRLGIGLYGVNPTQEKFVELEMTATLKTIISQIKKINAGETIGYARRGVAKNDMTIATIAIGYADGFSRSFSNGKGSVMVNGKKAPVVGNVNMDMTMIDITGIDAAEGDEVIIFGDALPIEEVAASIDTIPYEILTNTKERVKRIFVSEGI